MECGKFDHKGGDRLQQTAIDGCPADESGMQAEYRRRGRRTLCLGLSPLGLVEQFHRLNAFRSPFEVLRPDPGHF